jgi:hypothetical protein
MPSGHFSIDALEGDIDDGIEGPLRRLASSGSTARISPRTERPTDKA